MKTALYAVHMENMEPLCWIGFFEGIRVISLSFEYCHSAHNDVVCASVAIVNQLSSMLPVAFS